jgi:hypothetical protein
MSSPDFTENVINNFIKNELELFKQSYAVHPIPAIQDTRVRSILWFCYYFHDLVSKENTRAIISYVSSVMKEPNFDTFGWSRIIALRGAIYLLTNDSSHLGHLIANFSHHNSIERGNILSCLAIFCPAISFSDSLLQFKAEENLLCMHGGYEYSTFIYLSAQGSREEKLEWLRSFHTQITENQTGSMEVIEFINKLITNKMNFDNSIFLEMFSEIKSYILFKIITSEVSYSQLDLFTSSGNSSSYDFQSLWKRDQLHPLTKDCITTTSLFREPNDEIIE